ATIFQFIVHIRNKKTRYRGLIRNRIWAFARGIWINLVRIAKYGEKMCPWSPNKSKNGSVFNIFHLLNIKKDSISSFIFTYLEITQHSKFKLTSNHSPIN